VKIPAFRASRALDPFEVQARPAPVWAKLDRGCTLFPLVVEVVKVATGDRGGFNRHLLLRDQPVVLIKAPFAHQRVHLATAVAAELQGLIVKTQRHRHGIPAVGTRDRRGQGGPFPRARVSLGGQGSDEWRVPLFGSDIPATIWEVASGKVVEQNMARNVTRGVGL